MHLSSLHQSSYRSSAISLVGMAATVFCQVATQPRAIAQPSPFPPLPPNNPIAVDPPVLPLNQGLSFEFTSIATLNGLDTVARQNPVSQPPPLKSPNDGLVSFEFRPLDSDDPVVEPVVGPAAEPAVEPKEPFPPTSHPDQVPRTDDAGNISPSLAHLFEGDTDSLVARAIGCAEGTRTPSGGKTWAYQGHTDPGNGVWNLGTFSWQHGATSPEDADRQQLKRLRQQAIALTQQAMAQGIPWGLAEQLNALDLANQSPSAALNPGGYIDRLQQAYTNGLRGSEAILWARTWSYRHPSDTRWNAPGLGSTHHSIQADQKRRMAAIEQAIAHFPTRILEQV